MTYTALPLRSIPTFSHRIAGDDTPPDDTPPEDKSPVLTMTQAQLDDMIQARLKRDRATRQGDDRTHVARLKELESTLTLQTQEREQLQTYIDELEQKTMTAEEIRLKEEKKAKDKYENDLNASKARADQIEQKYIRSRIDTDLSIAAQQSGVLGASVPIVMSFLQPRTELEQVLDDDGKPTGQEKVIVNFDDVAEDGTPKTVKLSVSDTFKRMRELTDQYGNLFDKDKRGGLGGDNGAGSTNTDGYRPGMSMEDYYKARKDNPSAIYGS